MRRKNLMSLLAAFAVLAGSVLAEDPPTPVPLTDELETPYIFPGLPLAEAKDGVYKVRLDLMLKENGEGQGSLILDPNPPVFDDFGMMTVVNSLPPIKLDCTLKLVKKMRRPAPPGEPESPPLLLLGIRGPKITSKLFLARQAGDQDPGRLVVQGPNGKVKYAFNLSNVERLFEPCHPGCFPAGTEVRVPGGTRVIEKIGVGNQVTTINGVGKEKQSKVTDVFVTRNRLVEVKFKDGPLITTETQPICLVAGEFRPAGELKAGDLIWRWQDGRRKADAVVQVAQTDRVVEVFNLVMGEPTSFVANGFLVRSKPPGVGIKKPRIVLP